MCLKLRARSIDPNEELYYYDAGGLALIGGKEVNIDPENKTLTSKYYSHHYQLTPDGWVEPNPMEQPIIVEFPLITGSRKRIPREMVHGRMLHGNFGFHIAPLDPGRPLFYYFGFGVWNIPVLFKLKDVEISGGQNVIVSTFKPIITQSDIDNHLSPAGMFPMWRLCYESEKDLLNEMLERGKQ